MAKKAKAKTKAKKTVAKPKSKQTKQVEAFFEDNLSVVQWLQQAGLSLDQSRVATMGLFAASQLFGNDIIPEAIKLMKEFQPDDAGADEVMAFFIGFLNEQARLIGQQVETSPEKSWRMHYSQAWERGVLCAARLAAKRLQ